MKFHLAHLAIAIICVTIFAADHAQAAILWIDADPSTPDIQTDITLSLGSGQTTIDLVFEGDLATFTRVQIGTAFSDTSVLTLGDYLAGELVTFTTSPAVAHDFHNSMPAQLFVDDELIYDQTSIASPFFAGIQTSNSTRFAANPSSAFTVLMSLEITPLALGSTVVSTNAGTGFFDDITGLDTVEKNKIATITVTDTPAVPEPGTMAIWGLGSLLAGGLATRRKRRQSVDHR